MKSIIKDRKLCILAENEVGNDRRLRISHYKEKKKRIAYSLHQKIKK